MEIFLGLMAEMPWWGTVMTVMGFSRIIFKPVFTIVQAVVDATPTDADNKALDDFKASKSYSFIVWLLDYFASVKISK